MKIRYLHYEIFIKKGKSKNYENMYALTEFLGKLHYKTDSFEFFSEFHFLCHETILCPLRGKGTCKKG